MIATPTLTLSMAAALGVLLMALAHRMHVPSIALLLIAGVVAGPEVLGLVDPDTLGNGLGEIVGMAVAIVLFEGGLTLDLAGVRKNPRVIWRVLTIGVLITWLGTTVVTHYLLDLPWPMALLCGSLVIVTGPTVIAPLLRRIGVRERIKHILYWEAVLIDAIGVFIAVLCFEWLFPDGDHTTWSPLVRFGARVALGILAGLAFGTIISLLLHMRVVAEEYANIFVLATALTSFGLSEALLHESGILTVIVAGLIVGLTRPRQLAGIKRFKLELTEMAIGTLFILLSATLRLEAFTAFGWKLALAVATLILVLRPLVILIATTGAGFSTQEKLFLSWIAPRGIVAAFMASLFSISLSREADTAEYGPALQAFTFAVIGTTVILQGFSAPWLARVLGLRARERKTWLIIGEPMLAARLSEKIGTAGGQALALSPPVEGEGEDDAELGEDVVIRANPLEQEVLDDPRFAEVGGVFALMSNPYLNQLICERWSEVVPRKRCFHAADNAIDRQLGENLGFAGRSAWHHALPPGELCQRIESGNLAIDVMPAAALARDEQAVPLLHVDGESEIHICDGESLEGLGDTVVVSRPRIDGLAQLIRRVRVFDQEAMPFEAVIAQLLSLALEDEAELPVDELLATIVRNEQYMPMALGAGVAIPHAYHGRIDHVRCYVANVRGGLIQPVAAGAAASETGAAGAEGEPTRLVFLVLSPVGRTEEHLRGLAAIARLSGDPTYRALLEAERTDAGLAERIMARA